MFSQFQLHEFLEDPETARQVLCSYVDKNPDNPNAHLMLYKFYERHHHHGEEKLETLQVRWTLLKLFQGLGAVLYEFYALCWHIEHVNI